MECCSLLSYQTTFFSLTNFRLLSSFWDSLRFLCELRVYLYAASKKTENRQKGFSSWFAFSLRAKRIGIRGEQKNVKQPKMVGSSGLEPPTSRLSGVRSNHLSYEPMLLSRCVSPTCSLFLSEVVEMNGIEPMTPCLQSRCSPSWATPPCLVAPQKLNNDFTALSWFLWPWMLNRLISFS